MLENFLQDRIKALEIANATLRDREVVLTTYIYELLDRDTPREYKEIIRQEVFNSEIE